MIKTLRFTLVALMMLVCGGASAQTTINFKNIFEPCLQPNKPVLYLMNKEAGAGVQTVGDVTITIIPGNYSSAPAYQMFTGDAAKSNACIRLYGSKVDNENAEGSAIKLTNSKENMKHIVFVATPVEQGAGELNASCGTLKFERKTKNYVWTGDAKEVTFTVSRPEGKTGVLRFSEIVVNTTMPAAKK